MNLIFKIVFFLVAMAIYSAWSSAPDSNLENAYNLTGLNQQVARDKQKALQLLAAHPEDSQSQALATFIKSRSVSHARDVLAIADSPESYAIAYMCMAEAYYAKNDLAKAIMYSTLSLAHKYSPEREAQTKLYLLSDAKAPLSLKGHREEVLENIVTEMRDTYNPRTFRRLYTMATILGLLPDYPMKQTKATKGDQEPLHLCLSFDDRFAAHGGVTILSAMLSAAPQRRYAFHIMEDPLSPISDNNKKYLAELLEPFPHDRFSLEFISFDENLLPAALKQERFRHWPRSIFFKLFIPQMFPQYPRMAWLDADLIIRGDLKDFYTSSFHRKWFVGSRAKGVEDHLKKIDLPPETPYLNAGVILFNVSILNKNQSGHKISEYCDTHPNLENSLRAPEQDLLSLIFPKRIYEIEVQTHMEPSQMTADTKWNWFHQKHPSTRWDTVHNHFASVIHMAGSRLKPWKNRKSLPLWSWIPKQNDGVTNIYWALRDIGPWRTR